MQRQSKLLRQQFRASALAQPAPEPSASAGSALQPYLEFLRTRKQWLNDSREEETDRQRERRVLEDLHAWALLQSEASLRKNTPLEVYLELKVTRKLQEQAEAERKAAVEAKLNEYFDWAERRWAQVGRERVRSLDSRHRLSEHPLRTRSQDALTGAVLDWALTHN
jgi:hypothetical protein